MYPGVGRTILSVGSKTDRIVRPTGKLFSSVRLITLTRVASQFNPKPEAMAGNGMGRPHAAPAIASGFGLNELPDFRL